MRRRPAGKLREPGENIAHRDAEIRGRGDESSSQDPLRNGEEDAGWIACIRSPASNQAAQECYRKLTEKYWKVLTVLVRGRVGSTTDAEDIAQQAFARAYRSLDKLKDPRLFLGWLMRIAHNLATDHLRRRRGETSLDAIGHEFIGDDPENAFSTFRVTSRVEEEEELEIILKALPRLPDSYRAVLVLRYLEGYSNQEIAACLDEPEGTIRNRLFRALRKLRSLVEHKPPAPANHEDVAGQQPSPRRNHSIDEAAALKP